MRLYLIRHGQSTNNILLDNRQRTYDPDLTEIGHKQADILAKYLSTTPEMPTGAFSLEFSPEETAYNFTHLYCSPMHRTLLTAMPLAKAFGLQAQVWVDIHELGGLFMEEEEGVIKGYSGPSHKEMIEKFPDYGLPPEVTEKGWWDPVRGEEAPSEFLSRALRVVLQLRKRAQTDERIILVTHGGFMNLLVKGFLNQLPGHADDLFYAHYNTAITRLDFAEGPDRVRVHYLNRFDHLPPDLRTW
jgi:2,3-bisphosphoglycerate-dependent phosphoglycerate mutase